METMLRKHRLVYTDQQIQKLKELVALLRDTDIFISDGDPDRDILEANGRVNGYPTYGGGTHFLLATEKEEKFLFGLITVRGVEAIGKIEWEFSDENFKQITLLFDPGIRKDYRNEIAAIKKSISETLCNDVIFKVNLAE